MDGYLFCLLIWPLFFLWYFICILSNV
jgi:hypothetical protein